MAKPALYIQQPMLQKADHSEPPQLSPSVHDSFYRAIGELIVHWGLMEQQANILIAALLQHNSSNEPGWHNRSFDKRYDLLKAEWAIMSKGLPKLQAFPNETFGYIRKWKVLRDSISHKEMVLGLPMPGDEPSIQFYNKSRAKQKSKRYHPSDFVKARTEINNAAGWLFWITQPDADWQLPSQETQILRSLPNMDHLKIPT